MGCASQSSPTGGRKDRKPPTLVKTTPQNKSLNFNSQLIELEFNEYLRVENLKQELLITPNIDGNYQFKLTKAGVKLEFDKPFRANTTYTLNFRNTFKDITEKNIAKNIKLVFGTGEKLDTLSIKGNVKDVLTDKKVYDAVVSLYMADDTTKVNKDKPYYLTRTDSSGNYTFENLKAESYRIYAIEDKNGNLLYDQAVDKIAFSPEKINLTTHISGLDLGLVKIDKIEPKITDKEANTDKYRITFSEGLIKLKVTLPTQYQTMPYMLEKNKTLVLYKNMPVNDSIPITLMAVDSAGNTMNKEVKFKFSDESKKDKAKVKSTWSGSTEPKNGQEANKKFVYTIEFSKPVQTADMSKIKVLADTITPVALVDSDFVWNDYRTTLTIKKTINARREIGVRIPYNTFLSVENDTNKVIKTDHKLKEPENYGSIGGRITTKVKSFIVELLSPDYKVLEQIRDKSPYEFNYLTDGSYFVRVIEDDNGNGKWDTGDLETLKLPERIIYYPEGALKLKQNWELIDRNITL